MQGRQDVPGFIRAFTGDHRYIVDYLVVEVLQRQPAAIRNFLLQTSILNRLSGPLCDAVLERAGQSTIEGGRMRDEESNSSFTLQPSSFILEYLERANLFVVALDDRRQWYRYHHLFADVLQAHLRAEQPEQVATLHRRASEWYEQQGLAAEAIRHALAAEDFARAAALVELASPALRRSRQEATLLGWLKALPAETLRSRSVLSVVYAHVLLAHGLVEGVEERLRDAEQLLDMTAAMQGQPSTSAAVMRAMDVVDEEEFRHLPGMIAIARAGLALARGNVPGCVTYARRALDLAVEDDYLTRGGALGFLGLAAWTGGELETAHQMFAEGMASLRKGGNIADAINGANTLAAIRLAQGRLRQAMRTYEQGLQLATVEGVPVVRGAADMYVGMSEIYRERNDLDAATQHLLRSKEMSELAGFPQNRYRWYVAMARIREAEGDLDNALDLLDEAERLYRSDFAPNVRPVAALKVQVRVVQGRLNEALDWVGEQGLSAEDKLGYLREFEHITLARVLLALHRGGGVDSSPLEVVGLLERLLEAAEEGQRMGSVIEVLVLQALAHQTQGNIPTALMLLERALTLAEPEGYVRIFVDEGSSMATLLKEVAKKGVAPSHVRHLLDAFGKGEDSPPVSQPLIEPLSERELDVLRLLATDLTGPELARELMVSLSTIRTHTQNIYSKLGVNNRRAAVRRAGELALL
jgi:LuxR family maltose regulon positive regulatory protein